MVETSQALLLSTTGEWTAQSPGVSVAAPSHPVISALPSSHTCTYTPMINSSRLQSVWEHHYSSRDSAPKCKGRANMEGPGKICMKVSSMLPLRGKDKRDFGLDTSLPFPLFSLLKWLAGKNQGKWLWGSLVATHFFLIFYEYAVASKQCFTSLCQHSSVMVWT